MKGKETGRVALAKMKKKAFLWLSEVSRGRIHPITIASLPTSTLVTLLPKTPAKSNTKKISVKKTCACRGGKLLVQAANESVFFFLDILSDLNQAVPDHLADDSQTC